MASREIECPGCGWVERANVALELVKLCTICLMGLCFTQEKKGVVPVSPLIQPGDLTRAVDPPGLPSGGSSTSQDSTWPARKREKQIREGEKFPPLFIWKG